jgi:hypothetical protein
MHRVFGCVIELFVELTLTKSSFFDSIACVELCNSFDEFAVSTRILMVNHRIPFSATGLLLSIKQGGWFFENQYITSFRLSLFGNFK